MAKVLVAATLLPSASGCGGRNEDNASIGVGGTGVGQGGFTSAGGMVNGSGGSSGGTTLNAGGNAAVGGNTAACPDYSYPSSYVVSLPNTGSVAELAQACNWTGTFASTAPVAQVTLTESAGNPSKAIGTITFAPDVTNNAGYLTVSSISVAGALVGTPQQVGNAYQFDLTWDTATSLYPGMTVTLQMRVTTSCRPEYSSVRDLTLSINLVRCGSFDSPVWVSSGNTCAICAPLAEMIALPMPAPKNPQDTLPLPGQLELAVRPVARDGRYLVLMVDAPQSENDLTFSWQVSGGELLKVSDDVAVWTLPEEPGPHQVQVAATSGDSAGIGQYLHRDDSCPSV
jgi:hypothetical protein